MDAKVSKELFASIFRINVGLVGDSPLLEILLKK
jgi:hypothetical protein